MNKNAESFCERARRQWSNVSIHFEPRPNGGIPTGVDVDGDGRSNTSRDAQGFSDFPGSRGLAILSKFPIDTDAILDFPEALWTELPNHQSHDPSELAALQRLSNTSHVAVPIDTPSGRLSIIAFHATPPVFDGPEDRNGRRNADEINFAKLMIDQLNTPHIAITANANIDPEKGEGQGEAIMGLINHPQITAPLTLDRQNTANWAADGPGQMRVTYVLPSAGLQIIDAQVHWPPGMDNTASPHRMVWVDVQIP